jgi:Uma2 family endonuclease
MNLATQLMTLEDYFNYDNGTEIRYELVDGALVEMPPESQRNTWIAMFLVSEFLKLVPFQLVTQKTEIVVTGRRTRVRLPDVLVLTEELADAMKDAKRATITPEMPPPAIAVEVVSPGKENEDRDYRYKRSEYAARGIAEYWIVDPMREQITVLTLIDGLYEETIFKNADLIQSTQLSELKLTVDQVMKAGE